MKPDEESKSNWTFNGFNFDDNQIGDNIGFVYRITNTANGMRYIGKKHFTSNRTKKVVKKSAKLKKGQSLKGLGEDELKKRKKNVREVVESDWRDYFGSSNELKSDLQKFGKSVFRREILQLVKTRGMLSYYELRWQLIENAVIRPDYYNGILNVRLGRNVFPKSAREEAYKIAISENQAYAATQTNIHPDDVDYTIDDIDSDTYDYELPDE